MQRIGDDAPGAAGIDAVAAIVPGAGARARLAGVLTEADLATLRHLAEKGMGANSLRALTSDLAYIEAWAKAATGAPLPWPAPQALLLKFVAHHLWDPAAAERAPAHGMPAPVRAGLAAGGFLRSPGPHAPATVRRRLASWATLTAWRDLDGAFDAPALRKALRLAVRAQDRPRRRKSAAPVSVAVMTALLAPLDRVARHPAPWRRMDRATRAAVLRALRDRAMLSVGFAAGGRRRAEIAALRAERIAFQQDRPAPAATPQASAHIELGRTKTTAQEDGASVVIAGRAVADLRAWLAAARIARGSVFRRIDRWGHVSATGIAGQSVNLILKRRLAEAGFDPAAYSAHGLRAGFMTEAALAGLSLPETMAQSGHRSSQQAAAYFQADATGPGAAGRLLG